MTNEEKMTPEEAIAEISFLKVAVNKVMEQALDMAIQALSQVAICPSAGVDCEDCPAYEPCDDAVSRQAVIKLFNGNIGSESALILHKVKQLPSVTQKSGKWIHFAQSDDCSLCGYSTGKYGSPSKYCPNCGAKMESEDKE